MLLGTTYEVTRQLKSLGVPVDSWDMMVISILHSKLDPMTACEWELARNNNDEPKLSAMLEFLERRAAAYANMQPPTANQAQRRPTANQSTASSSTAPGTKTEQRTAKGKKQHFCLDCRQLHQVYECPIFRNSNLAKRLEYVDKKGLCPNCLRLGGHSLAECRYGPCRTCPGAPMHNPMLCPVKATRPNPIPIATAQRRPNTDDQQA